MAFIKFNKNNVDYTLFLGNHISSSYPLIKNGGGLKSLDVLVIESGGYNLNYYYSLNSLQYKEIFEKIPFENPDIKIYNTDCFPTDLGILESAGMQAGSAIIPLIYGSNFFRVDHKITRREAIKRIGSIGLGLAILLSWVGTAVNGFSDGEYCKIVSTFNSANSSLLPSPVRGFRDAVNARIIEEYIIPNEKKAETLNIGILFGADHTGIKEKIKYKFLRDKTIGVYKKIGYHGIDKDTLNKIEKVTYQDRAYRFENIFLDLF